MAMPDITTRSELGWPRLSSTIPVANTNLGMSAHYDGADKGLAGRNHTACITYWKNCRNSHMNGNGWSDIGYAYAVCPHGHILEGRGFGRQQAAQAQQGNKLPNGNSRWVTVTFMSGPTESPTLQQLAAWHRLRGWLRADKGVAATVHGHRDFSLTSCPGDKLYKLVQDGTLKNPASTPDLPSEDDDLMALPMLQENADSFDVKTLRALLYARGYVSDALVPDTGLPAWLDNTKFDVQLTNAVIGFQSAKDLDPDGIVGKLTWAKLLRQ